MAQDRKPKKNNRRPIWVILTIFAIVMLLLWLNGFKIQHFNKKGPNGLSFDPTIENTAENFDKLGQPIDKQVGSNQKLEGNESDSSSQNKETDETNNSLQVAYDNLSDPVSYSIYEYNSDQIEDVYSQRAFQVILDRLKEEGKFYSTIDYEITIYPTLDENISNIKLEERYANGMLNRGHYRFDYRAKKVSKY